MKKILEIIFTLAFALCLVSCQSGSTDEVSSIAAGDITSDTSSQIESKLPEITNLNPKTDFEFGKYITSFYSDDKSEYHIISLEFFKDFDGLEYKHGIYYTQDAAIERLNEVDITFSQDDYNFITIGGVKYYDLEFDYTILPESYEISETQIVITPDNENYGKFSLKSNGTLVLESSDDSQRYGKLQTVYALGK